MLKNNTSKMLCTVFLFWTFKAPRGGLLLRVRTELSDYSRRKPIVFWMRKLTCSYGWGSTSHRIHSGLEYWWRRMSFRITDLQNPIWTSLHLVFVLRHICIRVLVVYFHMKNGFVYLISSTRYYSCALWWVGDVGTLITWLYGCWFKKKPNQIIVR